MNDWIVANLNNSDFTISDFHDIADMNVNNTQMLTRDKYLKSPFIQNNPAFQTEDGKFSKDKFNKYYDQKLKSFQEFTEERYPAGPALDMFDTNRTENTEVKDVGFEIGRIISNPNRQKIGIEGVNTWSNPEKSVSELAQMSKIYDYEKGEFLDYSPNDRALFNGKHDYGLEWLSSLFSDPLVEAVYEEDGVHIDPITKQETKHKKGDHKLNEYGTYYYETLGGRSPIGKRILSVMDTITVDGTGINKYDMFDSDDVEKSVGGVVAKNVAAIAPLFMGPTVGGIYSLALIGREFSKSLPMLYGIATMFGDSDTPEWINSIAAQGEKFSGGTSQYAKEHTFSFENIGNLISDVALQWGQQKKIAQVMSELRGSDKYIDDAIEKAHLLYNAKKGQYGAQAASKDADWKNSILGKAALKKFLPEAQKATVQAGKLGRDLSLAYMAIISNSDVYNDMLQYGATKSEAAAVALGSTLGMFAVDKTGLGELMFDEATEESIKQARRALKNEFRQAQDNIFKGIKESEETPANKYIKYIQSAARIGKKFIENFSDDMKYHTTNLLQKMVGEGVEEVSEELVADTAKSIYELAGKLGMDTSVKDVRAWDNILERYSMNFLGGAIGGGIFYGKEVWDKGTFKIDKSDEELVTLIRNGHINELKDTLQKMKDAGKAGNTKLSATPQIAEDGSRSFITAEDKTTSQNDFIADMVNRKINVLDAIINNNQIGLDDDALFRTMVLGEQRFYKYQDISKITNYYQDFNNVTMDLIRKEAEYRQKAELVNGKPVSGDQNPTAGMTDESKALRQQELAQLENELQVLRDKKNSFLSGDNSIYYMRKLNFLMDPVLHSQFLPIDEAQIRKEIFGDKKQSDFTEEDSLKFWQEYNKRKAQKIKEQGTQAFDRFLEIEKIMSPLLGDLQLNAENLKQFSQTFSKLYDKEKFEKYYKKRYDSESKLDDESDEEYEYRNKPTQAEIEMEDEGKIAFNERIRARKIKIAQLNDQLDADWAANIDGILSQVGYQVDPITYRDLFGPEGLMPIRVRDVINTHINREFAPNPADSITIFRENTLIQSILKKLKTDLSNTNEIINTLRNTYGKKLERNLRDDILRFNETGLDKIISRSKDEEGNEVVEVKNIQGEELAIWLQDRAADLGVEYIAPIDILSGDLDTYLEEFTKESQETIKKYAKQVQAVFGKEADISDNVKISITSPESFDIKLSIQGQALQDTIKNEFAATENRIQSVINNIANNPIVKLQQKLQQSVKNPLIEITKALAGKVFDKKELQDIEGVLQNAMTDFQNIQDVNDFTLDETQLGAMQKAADLIKLTSTYLYAASAQPTTNTPFGHNAIFNDYVKHHQDVVERFEELPEIAADYVTIYNQEAEKYLKTIQNWTQYSLNNQINKQKQFIRTDKAFSKSFLDKTNDLEKSKAFRINIGDKEYDLLKGAEVGVNRSLIDTDKIAVPLYQTERILYKNFQDALYDSGLTLPAFLEQTGLLEKLGSLNIGDQKVSKLNDKLTSSGLTNFDTIQYFAAIFTLDPSQFYNLIKSRVSSDINTAPITAQEYGQKLIMAHRNKQFRDIMQYAHKKSGDERYGAYNTIILTGAAGSGKTKAEAKIATDNIDKNLVLAMGPTSSQASNLAESLGVTQQSTVMDFAKSILGENVYNDLIVDINNAKGTEQLQSKYFKRIPGQYTKLSINVNSDGNLVAITSKGQEEIKFKDIEKAPKVLVIDEATHIPAPILQILDLYMGQKGGQLILIGDEAQDGYWNEEGGIRSIEANMMFATRAPELTISLRDNNIQKQANLSATRALIDSIKDTLDQGDEASQAFIPNALNIMSKLNFRVYNGEEINGDLIVPQLSDDILIKIKKKAAQKKKGPNIGFIGNKQNSLAYKQLIEAGLKEDEDFIALDSTQMQGREFDYVISDSPMTLNKNSLMQVQTFVKNLYTLMSRGREAAIFIDSTVNGENKSLSKIIGTNKVSDYMAKAPSLNDKIDGFSAVDRLRALKMQVLALYDLSPIELLNPNTANIAEEVTNDTEAAFYEMVNNHKIDEETDQDIVQKVIEESKADMLDEYDDDASKQKLIEIQQEIMADLEDSNFTVPSFGNAIYLSVNDVKTTKKKGFNNIEYEQDEWIIKRPTKGPLRNLQALVKKTGETRVFWYESPNEISKMELQRRLYDIRSAKIHQHSYEDLIAINSDLKKYITKDEFDKGKILLEVRSADTEKVKALHSSMKEIGMEYNGKRYIVDLVFKTTSLDGRDKIIDLSAVNSPITLKQNLSEIKNKLIRKIDETTDNVKKKFLQNILNNIDNDTKIYEQEFQKWIDGYEASDKSEPYLVEVEEALDYNKTSWFKKRSKAAPIIRLGGKQNLDEIGDRKVKETIQNPTEHINDNGDKVIDFNFRKMHPELSISKVYTYSSKKNILENLDPSIKGRAVVFWSSDTLIKPEELINRYIDQKMDPANHKPTVRMAVLGNYGLSFSQLMDPETFETTLKDTDRKPLRQNLKGVHMFTSMWNFRAALGQFRDAYDTWQREYTYNDAIVENITHAAQDIYDGLSEQEALTKYGVTTEDLENLRKFNEETLLNIPIFRLGYQKNNNGFHVQQYDLKGKSEAYGDKIDVHLLSINKEKADTFYRLIDDIMSAISPNGSKFQKTLGLELKDPQTDKVFGKHELIDLKESKTKRTLAGLLHYDKENGLSIGDDKGNPLLVYTNDENWSFVSGFITHLARKVSAIQREDLGADREQEIIRIFPFENGKRLPDPKAELHVGVWFADGVLKTDNKFDASLLNMFDLIFHGTTQDIHDKNNRFQLEDALFKNGFYIDPDAARSKIGNNTITVGNSEDDAIFMEIGTPDNFFTIDIDTRAAGIGINISKLAKNKTTVEEKPKTKEETLTEEQKFLNTLDTYTRDKLIWYKTEIDGNIELNDKTLVIVADHINKNSIPGFISSMITEMDDEYLNNICYVEADGVILKQFSAKEFINKQLAKLGSTEEFKNYSVKEYKGQQRLFINDDYVFVNGQLIKAIKNDDPLSQIVENNKEPDKGPKRLFVQKNIPKLIAYIKKIYPDSIFDEDDEYSVGETTYTRQQYDEAANKLIALINTNNKKSEETLKSEIDSLMENNEILSGLNSAINNAKC